MHGTYKLERRNISKQVFFGRTIGIFFAIKPETGGYNASPPLLKSPLQPQGCIFEKAQSVSRDVGVKLEI